VAVPFEESKLLKVPCAGFEGAVKVSGSGGTIGSLPVSVSTVAVLNATLADCEIAVGVPAATVSETVAGLLVWLAELVTVNVKLSGPLKPLAGV
jgi:hypothetical protein